MKIGITGAAGHIGHRLAEKLVEEGHEVTALIHSNYRRTVLPDDIKIITGDIQDHEIMEKVTGMNEAVVHLAYSGGGFAESVNIESTKALFRRAEGNNVNTFVYASTLAAHPRVSEINGDPYVETKHRASNWIRENGDDMSTLTLFPSRVIGPGEYKLSRFEEYKFASSNRIIFPPMYSYSRTNYVHVDTVVDSIILGILGKIEGDQVVSGETLTGKQYYEKIANKSRRNHLIIPLPFSTLWLPFILNIVSKAGIIPEEDYGEYLYKETYVEKSLPADLENEAPVSGKSIDEAIEESLNWYDQSGMI